MNVNLTKVILWLFILLLISNLPALPAECITEESHANRYFKADLIIYGEVLSCTTGVIKDENTPGDSGWINRRITSRTSCFVRVDSVLKGYCPDSIIVIFYENTQNSRNRFWGLDDRGESLYVGEIAAIGADDKINIPSFGNKWIIFLVDKDGAFYFLWYSEYNGGNLSLYRRFEDKGEDYFRKHPSEFFLQQ